MISDYFLEVVFELENRAHTIQKPERVSMISSQANIVTTSTLFSVVDYITHSTLQYR